MTTEASRRAASRRLARARRVAGDESGVVAIEFALVLPLILMVLFAILDFGQVFNNVNDANQIAATGARLAAVDGKPSATSLQTYLKSQGDTQALRNHIAVCISFPTNNATGTSGQVGDPVKVRVTAPFKLVKLLGGSTVQLHGEAINRLERTPSNYSAGC